MDQEDKKASAIQDWQIKTLAVEIEFRGADATGIALVDDDGSIAIEKDDEIAWKFVSSKSVQDFLRDKLTASTRMALIHTRKFTVGSPFYNKNNHPLSLGQGAIIHNGAVNNHQELFAKYKLTRGADTDSDIIRAIVDDHGQVDMKLIKRYNEMQGGVASVIVHPNSPGKALFLRSGNPLVFGLCDDKLYFASTRSAIFSASKPWTNRWGFWAQVHRPDIAFTEMPDDTAFLVGPEGIEAKESFHPGYGIRFKDDYTSGKVYANYQKPTAAPVVTETPRFSSVQGRLRFWRCPNIKCNWVIDLKGSGRFENPKKWPLNRLHCQKCDANLGDAAAVADIIAEAWIRAQNCQGGTKPQK